VFDPDFQFHYLRARGHNPKSGRFLERDSVRGALTTSTALHRYAYAPHNPLAYQSWGGCP
jgi:RHS repeat-associated protein